MRVHGKKEKKEKEVIILSRLVQIRKSLIDRRTAIRREQLRMHESDIFNAAMIDAEADARVEEINNILNLIGEG